MNNATTNYQTSFRVDDSDGKAFIRLKAAVYGWILKKEADRVLRDKKSDFFFRCHWPDLFQTHSAITTDTYLNEKEGCAWAVNFTEVDRQHGRARFWHSEIGLKQGLEAVVVSVRNSFAWNTEYLNNEPERPHPSVPTVIRYILDGNKVFSGRSEFQLKDKPIRFSNVGDGRALCTFIQSPQRRYPLIVFNGDSTDQVGEADRLAFELTGKCQVVVIADNEDLSHEIQHYLPEDYWVRADRMRVYFPFNIRRNTPDRHRWYNVHRPDYLLQREGMINGLLRHNNLSEEGAVETVEDIKRLVSRDKLLRVKPTDPEQQKVLEEFLIEHAKVAQERDDARSEAAEYANQVDALEKDKGELKWKVEGLQLRLADAGDGAELETAKLLPILPLSLLAVSKAAKGFFPRLVITERALETAEAYDECKSFPEAWEMLGSMNEVLYRLKFEDGEKELERAFKDATGYDLAMSEGKMTKDDSKLMRLRRLQHDGAEYDVTPHVKHGTQEPKLVRIHFAFDESRKKIVIGHIGRHIANYTSKTM